MTIDKIKDALDEEIIKPKMGYHPIGTYRESRDRIHRILAEKIFGQAIEEVSPARYRHVMGLYSRYLCELRKMSVFYCVKYVGNEQHYGTCSWEDHHENAPFLTLS